MRLFHFMKNSRYYHLISFIAVTAVIYFWFLKWKTGTIYGDDLTMFIQNSHLNSFHDKVNLELTIDKYRPVHGVVYSIIVGLFKKNLNDYYLFNVAIQAINTLVFAQLLNLFLKSRWFALLFSLLLGLSRFSFYSMTQLLNGGALEGLAMTFFLLSVFYVLKVLVNKAGDSSVQLRSLIISSLLANLALYTHERYVVLLPFILLIVAFAPAVRHLAGKQKIILAIFVVLSVTINVLIKKWIYAVPFFVGTGGTNITFSFASASAYFIDGVLSICEINSKPEYLTGITFFSLHGINIMIPILLFSSLPLILTVYLVNVRKAFIRKNESTISTFLFLIILFVLCLAPAVVTIRLEQRWLQASLSIFILLVVISLAGIPFKNNFTKTILYLSFITLFLSTEFIYLWKGADVIYISSSQKMASLFKKAIDEGIVNSSTNRLIIVEKAKDPNGENEVSWTLSNGDFFQFYLNKNVQLSFADSVYERVHSNSDTTLRNFNKNTDRMVCLNNGVINITGEFLKDSLKDFSRK